MANENSLANGVKEGIPIKILDIPPPFVVEVAFALDKSGPPTAELLAVLNKIVADMHADGTLTRALQPVPAEGRHQGAVRP